MAAQTLLTEKQWLFLARFAESHGTTLNLIARHVIGATPKAATGTDRKWTQDRARCAAAVGILERYLAKNVPEHPALRESVALELKRMRRAYDDPALLWTIYRRADRGATAYSNAPATLARTRKAA